MCRKEGIPMWASIQFKLGEADFFLGKMRQVLIPAHNRPELRASYKALASSPGTIIVTNWQPQFYYNFDAFLAATRSIPNIIQTWCGWDARAWQGQRLPLEEKTRRKRFQEGFSPLYTQFSQHPLSRARNITIHRGGTPPIDVEVTGQWGIMHQGGPTQHIPLADIPPAVARRDPTLPTGPVPLLPLEPTPEDFFLRDVRPDGSIQTPSLFPTCEDYLKNTAYGLVGEAEKLRIRVHGSEWLTPP
jgi:hypothetical protein